MPYEPKPPLTREKRRHPRLEGNIPVKITSDQGDILTETINLSTYGALFRISQRLEPMTKLKIHLLLPLRKGNGEHPKKISFQAVVVRVQASQEDGYDTAIFFSDIAPKDSRAIDEFIEYMVDIKNGKFN